MAFSVTTTTGNTFTNGDSATAIKLNNQVNAMSFASTAHNSFLAFDGSGNPIDGSAGTGLAMASGALSLQYRPLVLASDFSVTNSTTFTPVTGLSYTMPGSGTFTFQVNAYLQVAGSEGIKWNLGGTMTTSFLQAWSVGISVTTLLNQTNNAAILGSSWGNFNPGGSDNFVLQINGSLVSSGTGTLLFQIAQVTSSSSASKAFAGTNMVVSPV